MCWLLSMLVLHAVYKVHVFAVYMFHSNTVYKVQCSLCTCSVPILCSLQTSLTEHIHLCLSAAYISHSIIYTRLGIYPMSVLWTDYNCSVSVFCSTRHIPCQYLCSVLHHSAYSMSTSVQCSAPLGIFHVSNVCQKGGLSEWLVIRWIKFETVQSDKHTTKPYLSLCKFSYFGVFMSFEIVMWGS